MCGSQRRRSYILTCQLSEMVREHSEPSHTRLPFPLRSCWPPLVWKAPCIAAVGAQTPGTSHNLHFAQLPLGESIRNVPTVAEIL